MSLAITPTAAAINVYGSQTFVATGGVPPYTFALVSGEGDIASDTGLYTAPFSSGSAVVSVTDSDLDPVTVQATVNINTALTWFCNILAQELGLDPDQVYLWDQKIQVPNDQRLYIAVGILNCKPFANTRKQVSTSGLDQLQSVNMYAQLTVDIFSYGKEARDRKEEVIMALNSVYSEQVQEANGFGIALLPTGFVNLSQIEGSSIPYRFQITAAIQYAVIKQSSVEYYDSFQDPEITTDP